MDGAAAQRSIPQPQPCGLECPPHPRPVRSPAGPVVQEQDRLGMKSQLEGAGLGLPLQGGAWGHDPGSRRPRREAAVSGKKGRGQRQGRGTRGLSFPPWETGRTPPLQGILCWGTTADLFPMLTSIITAHE